MKKINVLIIDDSAIVREILCDKLSQNKSIIIVGTATDPFIAREKIVSNKVDVIILDIEMPRMDGLTFLKYLMKYYPIPVIILSSLTDKGKNNYASIKALEFGAIDIVPKPGGPFSVTDVIEELIERINIASEVDFEKVKESAKKNIAKINAKDIKYLSKITTTNKLITIGASTGGTTALETVFKDFKKNFPPTVAAIHMPEKFTYTFANRLNDICEATVKEAENNDRLLNGTIYIAPGNYHVIVKTIGSEYILKTVNGPRVNNQRPSIDVLFKSVAENIGKNSIGVLLTGMGKDGAEGLLDIKNSGGETMVQDEATSIVFGMPKEAIDIGAAETVLPINKITKKIIEILAKF